MAKTKTVRVIPFIQIEDEFELVPFRLGARTWPAVARKDGGYSIRVLKSQTWTSAGSSVSFDFFELDAEGNVTAAPRGYARDYKPGRILVGELDAAVAKYAEAVNR